MSGTFSLAALESQKKATEGPDSTVPEQQSTPPEQPTQSSKHAPKILGKSAGAAKGASSKSSGKGSPSSSVTHSSSGSSADNGVSESKGTQGVVAVFLPRNTDLHQLASLVPAGSVWNVERNYVNARLKGVTLYCVP